MKKSWRSNCNEINDDNDDQQMNNLDIPWGEKKNLIQENAEMQGISFLH